MNSDFSKQTKAVEFSVPRMKGFMLFVFFIITFSTGSVTSFLMNATFGTGGNGYDTMMSLLLDEKLSRHQLENRLDNLQQAFTSRLNSLEHSYSEETKILNNTVQTLTKELQKDRNNRQQLIDENTKMNIKLINATEDRNQLQRRLQILNNTVQTLSASNRKLNAESEGLTRSRDTLQQEVKNLTEDQALLSNKYHLLLEQYLKITSNNTLVDNRTVSKLFGDVERRLQSLNNNISTNTQNIKDSSVQIGFSLKTVDKSSDSNRLKFSTVYLNTNNAFNISSGEFVCRLAGLYFFTATIVREPGTVQSYCFIYVNGAELVGTVGYGSNTDGYASGTTYLAQHLNVGDRVYLGGCLGIDHMYRTSTFTGILVTPDLQ